MNTKLCPVLRPALLGATLLAVMASSPLRAESPFPFGPHRVIIMHRGHPIYGRPRQVIRRTVRYLTPPPSASGRYVMTSNGATPRRLVIQSPGTTVTLTRKAAADSAEASDDADTGTVYVDRTGALTTAHEAVTSEGAQAADLSQAGQEAVTEDPAAQTEAAQSQPTVAKQDEPLTPHSSPAPNPHMIPTGKKYPTATRATKWGFVKSPYAPYNELDATGLASGSLARDPSTGKIFQMP